MTAGWIDAFLSERPTLTEVKTALKDGRKR